MAVILTSASSDALDRL